MKTLFLTIAAAFISVLSYGQTNSNYQYIDGYYRSNGTYVEGYYRTAPNNTINDNYSTYPNVNPWTGQQGTIAPDYNSGYSLPSSSNNLFQQNDLFQTNDLFKSPW